VCTSLQTVDANKDMTEYVTRAATGTEKPGTCSQFSSVQLENFCFTRSYNKNYDGCTDA